MKHIFQIPYIYIIFKFTSSRDLIKILSLNKEYNKLRKNDLLWKMKYDQMRLFNKPINMQNWFETLTIKLKSRHNFKKNISQKKSFPYNSSISGVFTTHNFIFI